MRVVKKILLNPITTLLLPFLALVLGIVSFIGCDFVRLQFGAINENSFIFPNDEWFGLGLVRHQDFATGKTASTWEHSSTCYDYSELDGEMFRSTNVKTASNTFIAALVFSAITMILVLVMTYRGLQSKSFWLGATIISFLSGVLQIVALTTMMDSNGRSVCSIERYADDVGGMWAWYVDYPSAIFPHLAYIRFFQSCELGSTGRTAIAGIFFQIAAAVLYILNYLLAYCDNSQRNLSIPIVSEVPREGKMVSKEDFDEEAQDHTIEGSYENNQFGPLAISAPQPVPGDTFNDDNISYVNGIEDEIRVEDDLSMDANDEPTVNDKEEDTIVEELEIVYSPLLSSPSPPVEKVQKATLPTPPVEEIPNATLPSPPVEEIPNATLPSPPVEEIPNATLPSPPVEEIPNATLPSPPVEEIPNATLPSPPVEEIPNATSPSQPTKKKKKKKKKKN